MDAQTFGRFVADIRRKQNLTQAQLAKKINVTDKAVSKWERGAGLPDIHMIEPLANVLGLSIQQLMKTDKNISCVMPEFHIEDGYIRPFGKNWRRIWARDTSILPEDARKHVEAGGMLGIRKHPENGTVTVYMNKDSDEGFVMDASNMMIEIKTRPEYVSELMEPFRSFIKNGGKMYNIGEPKNGYITIVTGLEPDAFVFMERHMWRSEIFDQMSLKEILDEMKLCVNKIKDRNLTEDEQYDALVLLRDHLMHCLELEALDGITGIYKEKHSHTVLWFDPQYVSEFLIAFTELLNK